MAPWNPVYERTSAVVDGYMDPYFSQSWDLFAPDPIDSNPHVLVRAKVKDSIGWERHTEWTDLTVPEMEHVRGHLLPRRVSRLVGGAKLMMAQAGVPPIERSPPGAAGEDTGEGDPGFREKAVRYMRAIATLGARARWGDGVTSVQVRVEDRFYPRYDEQDGGEGETEYAVFHWWPPAPVTAEAVRLWKDSH